jgi:hypothetical protein
MHMTEIVPASTADEDWIRLLGKEKNSFVITKDNKIKKNKAELLAWEEANLTIVFMRDAWFDLEFWDICWKFIKVWPNLKKIIIRDYNRKRIMIHVGEKIEELQITPLSRAKKKMAI